MNREDSAIKAPLMNRYHDSRLIRGKATSLAPIMMGKKKFPNDAARPGMTNRKIMITPCRVNRAL